MRHSKYEFKVKEIKFKKSEIIKRTLRTLYLYNITPPAMMKEMVLIQWYRYFYTNMCARVVSAK